MGFELHNAIDQRINRVIATHADVTSHVELGSALTNDDVATDDMLATESLNAQHFGVRIPTVFCTTTSFF